MHKAPLRTECYEFEHRALRVFESGVASFEVGRYEFWSRALRVLKSGVTNLITKRYERWKGNTVRIRDNTCCCKFHSRWRIYLWYSLPLTEGPLGRHRKWNKSENLPFANGLKPAGLRGRIRTIFLAKLEFSFQNVVTRDRIFSYTWMLRLHFLSRCAVRVCILCVHLCRHPCTGKSRCGPFSA